MAGESGADRVEDDIRRLYERVENLTPAELDSPEFTRIMNEFFASNARNDGMHSGIEVRVDLPLLITEVVVGPEVEPMQSRSRALVESVAKNLGCKITSSTLLVKPY